MAPTPFELADEGLFRDAAKAIDTSRPASTNLRVLRAQLEVHIGSLDQALRDSNQLLKSHQLTTKEQSVCWEIVGRVCLGTGQITEGLRGFNRALTIASGVQDVEFEARILADYVYALLNWVSAESAALEIPKLRQISLRTGSITTTITLHTLVAQINARKGLIASATAHASIARELLTQRHNVWQQGRLAIVAYAIAALQGDYASALTHTEEAIRCADKSGSREILASVDSQIPQLIDTSNPAIN